MPSINLSRKELYKRVWDTPITKLAVELGVSDVAIHKTCRKLSIPKPPRGYWARLKSGRKEKKPPLLKLPKALERKFALEASPSIETGEAEIIRDIQALDRVKLPKSMKNLHSTADKLWAELLAIQPDQRNHDLVIIKRRPDLPCVSVSEAMIPSIVRLFQGVVSELESRGLEYKPFRGIYHSPEFYCGQDTLTISIEEPIITVTRKPTEQEKRQPSWEWNLSSKQLAGRLIVKLDEGNYYNRKNSLIEQKPAVTLEEFGAQVIEAIWKNFMDRRNKALESARSREKQKAANEIHYQQECITRHKKKIDEIKARRMENLLRAAQWWGITNVTRDFIQACEERWISQSGELTDEEKAWLAWARQIIPSLPTADFEYPNATDDGPLESSSIPIGGPYPPISDIPRPPSMPPPPSEREQRSPYYREPEQFPFWLKHPR